MKVTRNLELTNGNIRFYDKHGKSLDPGQVIIKIRNRIKAIADDFLLFLLHLSTSLVLSHHIRKLILNLYGIKIGAETSVHMGSRFFHPKGITIGEDTIIGNRIFLDGRGNLTIGNHVDIASEVMIYTSEHDLNDPEFRAIEESVEIGDYVFIGPRVIILPGVKIGNGAVVAAGAVVTKNVDPFQIVGGVPAKLIGERKNQKLSYRLGRARLFQ